MSVNNAAPSNIDVRTLSHDELAATLDGFGWPKFRAKQVEDWLWKQHVVSFDQMGNLPAKLRNQLNESYVLGAPKELTRQASSDGSVKYLLQYSDGTKAECVGMPNGNKLSVCVSTQAGCRMGCVFCATGLGGFNRSLTALEIFDQVVHVANDFNMRASSVVMMGQGEPFNNYDEVLAALRLLNNPDSYGIGARHLTVSTCGILPMIQKFAKEPEQFTLAVSLHSAVQSTRNALMPGVKKYSLVHLHQTMAEYVEKTGRRPTYEYALIGGVNDNATELQALCDFTQGTLAHVNLIQLNDHEGSRLKPSTPEKANQFVKALGLVGVEATVRNSRGNDIDAACGQLSQKHR